MPRRLIPGAQHSDLYSSLHWLLTCAPCFLTRNSATQYPEQDAIRPEDAALLYPLHQTLCLILQHLTTTSLLTAELQLLSVALINILLLAKSPQVIILKAVLWGGSLSLILLCGQVIRWGISLARVPKWRFRRAPIQPKSSTGFALLKRPWPFQKARYDGSADLTDAASETDNSADRYPGGLEPYSPSRPPTDQFQLDGVSDADVIPASPSSVVEVRFGALETPPLGSPRRHTLPISGKTGSRSKVTTPSGRRKRSASNSVRAYFSLTQKQATLRRWLYATYLYICILATVFVGIREYVQRHALSGREPVGWAMGYLFGGLSRFRFEVVKSNLENWICLPDRLDTTRSPSTGWAEHLRVDTFGVANTRLALSVYWVAIIIIGLAVVFRLSPVYEVDTRRKVFHFMMVAMFLPTIFLDPTYIALALSLMLAIFLLLDLVRASQLPPLSKPIAAFLTPYVDGRDLRGPVVISHIFLLIGCAIPLWLSLASLPRTGQGMLSGWEVPTRDVSMVSGVVCVGLGDAAASLIGRRWGHRKWLWGGGKSIEGSLAFAAAVFAGLMAASIWLRVGGWTLTVPEHIQQTVRPSWKVIAQDQGIARVARALWSWLWGSGPIQKTALCASIASLTEAVLTGGNDNVVVPVVLWTCVKGMGI